MCALPCAAYLINRRGGSKRQRVGEVFDTAEQAALAYAAACRRMLLEEAAEKEEEEEEGEEGEEEAAEEGLDELVAQRKARSTQ